MVHRTAAVLCICIVSVLTEENNRFFLTAAKSVPRIGRSANKNSNSDFEKFFLKASKSVPRIGRRNDVPFAIATNQDMLENQIKYPTWSDIANRYEYEPELFNSPELLSALEQQMGDDPSVYEWDKFRFKRNIPSRFQFTNGM